eukprot:818402-Prymnesium_polylepis.1
MHETTGMGVFFYGFAWHVPLARDRRLTELPASALEAMTGGLAIETAGRMVLMADDVELTSDALVTWAMMVEEAKSTLLGSIHGAISERPTYVDFVARGNLSIKHRWGLANAEGDDVSRGYVDQVRDLCAAGGLRYQPQTLPDESDGW